MKVAALDLGTNTFLCLVAEVQNGQVVKVYSDSAQVVRLGQDVAKNRRFHPEALERAKACLQKFSQDIKKQNPQKILAMATSAARDVTNADDLFDIGNDLGIPIEVIPGGLEAQITYLGATSALASQGEERIVIDVGGGSTEFILGLDNQVIEAKSFNIGCVRLTESFVSKQPVSESDFERLQNHIDSEISNFTKHLRNRNAVVIAVAGTPTALAAIELGGFDAAKIDAFRFSVGQLQEWTATLARMSVDERINKYGLEPGRADVIFVGSMILWRSLVALGSSELRVSTRGVRFGVAIEAARR